MVPPSYLTIYEPLCESVDAEHDRPMNGYVGDGVKRIDRLEIVYSFHPDLAQQGSTRVVQELDRRYLR